MMGFRGISSLSPALLLNWVVSPVVIWKHRIKHEGIKLMRQLQPGIAAVVLLSHLFLAGPPLLTPQHVGADEPPKKSDKPKAEKPARCLTFAFSGKVADFRDASRQFDKSVQTGSKFYGIYTFDPGIRNSNPNKDPTVADYRHNDGRYGIVVWIGNYEFRSDPGKVNFLMELVARRECHNYLLRSYENTGSGPGFPVDGVDHISWQLDDRSAKALADVSLPLQPPVLKSWKSIFGLTLTGPRQDRRGRRPDRREWFLRGHVDSIAVADAISLEQPKPRKLVAKELESACADLLGHDMVRGFRAAQLLRGDPAGAVPLLKQRLTPKPRNLSADKAKHSAKLLAALKSRSYHEREKASRDLKAMGDEIEGLLHEALAAKPSPESMRRLCALVSALEKKHEDQPLRPLRVIVVMESLGTRQALEALQAFANLEPHTRVGEEANAAARRLSTRLGATP
jgi:hypothetical protein